MILPVNPGKIHVVTETGVRDRATDDQILNALRRLDDPRVYQDVSELSRLQSQITEQMKRFEFGLRRQADANATAIVLTGTEEVPEDFRKLVQEYFRSLARTTR